MKKREKFSIIYQEIDQRGRFYLYTKNDQIRIFEKSKFSQIVNFRAKFGPLREIQTTTYVV